MKVRVLKVDNDQGNLGELAACIAVGHTVDNWEMPKHSEPGDIAVWYASSPRQAFVAWGWVSGDTEPGFRGNPGRYTGPVEGVRALQPEVPRMRLASETGYFQDPNSVVSRPQTVPDELASAVLRSLGPEPQASSGRVPPSG